ncbi:MAG TPA: efflux RND transporter periplasmic adaptor subunit [Deferrisomatales bacterium]|nr:efflux RND transporter periplasmic adaptor subunit [Deferrisomatales bacterium]
MGRTDRRHTRRLLVLLLLLSAAGAGLWTTTRPQPVAVVLRALERGAVEATVANTRAGTVKACSRARLAPSTGGWIVHLPARRGERVKAGEVLLELWNDDLRAALTLAESEAAAAAARADEACTTAEVAAREAERSAKLLRQGVASEELTDRAVGEAKARRAGCEAAQATAQVSAARIAVARANLKRTLLLAPFAGTVAEVNAELGEFVTPSPVGVATLPAVDLVDLECLYVAAPIDEVDAPSLRLGMPVQVSLDAYPGRQFPGTVRRIAAYVLDREKQARTVEVEVDLADPGAIPGLLPGYSADVEVVLAVREAVVRVPTEAVIEGQRVLVYRPHPGRTRGTLEEVTFEPGLSSWEYTEVVSGLEEGTRVVVSIDREGVAAGALAEPQGDFP